MIFLLFICFLLVSCSLAEKRRCEENYYGYNCEKCSHYCASTCDNETGHCSPCLNLYSGNRCHISPVSTPGLLAALWPYILLIIIILVFTVTVYFCLCCKKKVSGSMYPDDDEYEEEEEEDHDTEEDKDVGSGVDIEMHSNS